MSCGAMKVTCDDGFEIVSKDQKELVAMTQRHLQNTHQKHASEAEILAMAKHP
jgi:predicted small metal-binding protein